MHEWFRNSLSIHQYIRVRDFLLGVRVDEIGDESNNTNNVDQAFEDLTEAERLRLVYEILTQPETEGGAGISNEMDDYVESIMPLHDDKFNNVSFMGIWQRTALTKQLGNILEMAQILVYKITDRRG